MTTKKRTLAEWRNDPIIDQGDTGRTMDTDSRLHFIVVTHEGLHWYVVYDADSKRQLEEIQVVGVSVLLRNKPCWIDAQDGELMMPLKGMFDFADPPHCGATNDL